jgi:GAF domain-containing protein
MPTPARKAQSKKGTARAGIRRAPMEPKASKLAEAEAAYKEALEQQAATADILHALSRSSTNAQPVFDAIVRHAHRLCGAVFSILYRYDGRMLSVVADNHASAKARSALRSMYPAPASREHFIGRAVLEGRVLTSPDLPVDPRFPKNQNVHARAVTFRSTAVIPLLHEGKVLGAIGVARVGRDPFTKKETLLLQTFAAQAVIAIENARLFNETKEALERQTATAEILKVISSSTTDTQPVFEAIVRAAARLFQMSNATIFMRDGDLIHLRAVVGATVDDAMRRELGSIYPIPFDPEVSTSARAMVEGRINICVDTEAPEVAEHIRRAGRAGGFRSNTVVPLVREGQGIGTIVITHPEAGQRLNEKQLELLRTFADQAVIAIENVRLFNELQTRNRDLTESLEQQTATGDILKVISSSPTDVLPVFETIARNAVRLCNGRFGALFTFDGKMMGVGAMVQPDPEARRMFLQAFPQPITPTTPSAIAILERRVVKVADVLVEDYSEEVKQRARAGGYRSILTVPMMRGDTPIGAIAVTRPEAQPFSDAYVALLKTFADQAVIAVENVRLFTETKEALERQTVTSEILRVISSSTTDTQPVFDAIARSGARLFSVAASFSSVNVLLKVGDLVNIVATSETDADRIRVRESFFPVPVDSDHMACVAIREARLVDVPDAARETVPRPTIELMRRLGNRAVTIAPMLREGTAIGAIVVTREQAGALSEQQLALLRTFADQAVIAIENVRLFNETKEALEQQTATTEILKVISSSPTDTQPVFDAIVRGAARLFEDGRVILRIVSEGRLERSAVALGTAWKGEGAGTSGSDALLLDPNSLSGRAILRGDVVHVPDIDTADWVGEGSRRIARQVGYRALLVAPMLKDDAAIGTISVVRVAPGPFQEKRIALLRVFANQAVIAIENVRLFHEIEEKSRQLEEASQHKSHFLASMSHELRTPLNAILGFNEMILGQVYGEVPADMQEPLKDIQTSGKHLLRLINNVLDLAKIEAGRMELALADYSVQDMVESVRSTLRPLAAEKGLEFHAKVPADLPLAHGDGGRLTQCLMNLAGNSLKFTKAGRVEIGVAQENGRIRFQVADTGMGIPPDKIAGLFTEFKQTDATIASEFGGTGLGLSITKKFVEMHGGRIWVESEPGRGSTFLFEVPLRVGA